ncbi:sensor histidine kinase [Aminobacter sp. Piv2-1]|uniref:sensor histidine kinase n=1 Tax=Aminobacter sp. Piv2-1 TaxID=3031122 RepID=UPI0030959368
MATDDDATTGGGSADDEADRPPEAADRVPDPDLDRLTGLAAAVADTPAALLLLADDSGGWTVVSSFGLTPAEAATLAAEGASALPAPFPFRIETPVPGRPAGNLLVLDRIAGPEPEAATRDQLEAIAALVSSLLALRDRSLAGARAEAALMHAETRRALALEAAQLASWVWDPQTGIVECDMLLPRLFNRPPATRMRARDIVLAIDRRDVERTRRTFRDALAGNDDYSGEYRVRGIDPPRWLAARGRVVERDAAGRPTLVFGVNYDITERHTAEERQRLLLRELNHRVKNTLATVQALASQTVRHAREPRQFLDAFSERLRALGLAHGLLSDHEWRGIGIRELARLELSPFDEADAPRISIAGQDVLLDPDQTLGLALVLHELASNALKYGALSVPAGRVTVSWVIQGGKGERRLVLDWTESGGPEVTPPTHHGFGSILIRRGLAKVISSEVRHEYLPEGVRAEVSMPLASEMGRQEAQSPETPSSSAAAGPRFSR